MLWVDGDFVTAADLQTMDSEIATEAITESITIDGDLGAIRRAKSECQQKISRFMSFENFSPTDLTFRDVNMPLTVQELRYNYAAFAQLVVSGESESNWSALKNWVVAKTLCEVYRRATNKAKDRYSDRYEDIKEKLSEEYWPNFKRRGLPIVFNPLPAPGAIMERVGLFTSTNVALIAGAGTVTVDYDFAVTWVGVKYVDSTNKGNQESFRSARVTKTMVNAKVAQISIAGLTPPNGSQPEFTKSYCRYSPGVAVGWNVWAGVAGGTLYRQNIGGPIALGTTAWPLPADPILSGEELDLGQFENVILEVRSQLRRA